MDKKKDKAIAIWQKASEVSKMISEASSGFKAEEVAIGMGLSAAFIATKMMNKKQAGQFFNLIMQSALDHYHMSENKN